MMYGRGREVHGGRVDLAEDQVAQALRGDLDLDELQARRVVAQVGLGGRAAVDGDALARHLQELARAMVAAPAQDHRRRAHVGARERHERLALGGRAQRGQEVDLAPLEPIEVGRAVAGGHRRLELHAGVRLHEIEQVGGEPAVLALAVDEAERREIAFGGEQQHRVLGDPRLLLGRQERIAGGNGRGGRQAGQQSGHGSRGRRPREARPHPADDVTTIQCRPCSSSKPRENASILVSRPCASLSRPAFAGAGRRSSAHAMLRSNRPGIVGNNPADQGASSSRRRRHARSTRRHAKSAMRFARVVSHRRAAPGVRAAAPRSP